VRNEKARRFLLNMRKKPGVNFATYFPRAEPGAVALLRRMLSFDPADRPTSEVLCTTPNTLRVYLQYGRKLCWRLVDVLTCKSLCGLRLS
jgi:hypothetical protein